MCKHLMEGVSKVLSIFEHKAQRGALGMRTIKTEEAGGGNGCEVNPLRMMYSDHITCILSCCLYSGDAWQIKMLGLKPILASTSQH